MNKAAKWTIALSVSLAAHAGVAIAFLPDAPPPFAAIRGGEEMDVAILGNAFEETLQAGEPTDAVDPLEAPPEEVSPVEPETSATETETIAPETPPETPPETVAEAVPDAVPSEADVILPADAVPPVAAEEPEVVASLPPVATVIPEVRPEQAPEPKVVEKPVPKKPVKRAEPEKPKKKAEPRKNGQDGDDQETARRGRADGAETATATSAGKGTKASQAGNASFSNYEGKVRSKLNRSVRYPSKAESRGVKGVVHLQFVVAANGAVSGVRITKSGGSPALDTAALDAARRASPFPKIPEAAGRSSWTFTVPISFTR